MVNFANFAIKQPLELFCIVNINILFLSESANFSFGYVAV